MAELTRWQPLGERALLETSIFRVAERRYRLPDRDRDLPFYVIRSPDWVNVIALTPRDEVVLIRQYRVGTDEIALEIPGGMVDPGETPAQAAARELAEETGYVAESLTPLGRVAPNPAIQDNACHTFLARGCRRLVATDFDPDERIEVELAPLDEVRARIADGRINHALVVAAFFHLLVTAAR